MFYEEQGKTDYEHREANCDLRKMDGLRVLDSKRDTNYI